MTPHPQPTPASRLTRATLLLAVGGALFFLAMPGTAQPGDPAGDDAEITVVFDEDDMGFNATSSKDLSNVWVVLCDGSEHKHDGLNATWFVHREDQVIAGVYVKSGNNGIEGNEPPGAGEFFANEGVDCSGSETETETSGSETETETSGSETDTETDPGEPSETDTETDPAEPSETDSETSGSDTHTETEEIPVFGAPTTVALAIGGALGGALLMLRRRL